MEGGLLITVASLVVETSAQSTASVVKVHVVKGSVALRYVGSSWTRDQSHVPCTGRWILHH